jgi:hypothetical protein
MRLNLQVEGQLPRAVDDEVGRVTGFALDGAQDASGAGSSRSTA